MYLYVCVWVFTCCCVCTDVGVLCVKCPLWELLGPARHHTDGCFRLSPKACYLWLWLFLFFVFQCTYVLCFLLCLLKCVTSLFSKLRPLYYIVLLMHAYNLMYYRGYITLHYTYFVLWIPFNIQVLWTLTHVMVGICSRVNWADIKPQCLQGYFYNHFRWASQSHGHFWAALICLSICCVRAYMYTSASWCFH